jgi:hypothetical protein
VSVAKLSGTAADNSLVYLSQNDVLLATVKAGAAGNWSYTFTKLPNGVHTIVAGTTAPTVDGTIAAITFDLVAKVNADGPVMGFQTPRNAAPSSSEGSRFSNEVFSPQLPQGGFFTAGNTDFTQPGASLLPLHSGASAPIVEWASPHSQMLAVFKQG